jgi:indole-3-glycerol phosphate synthase
VDLATTERLGARISKPKASANPPLLVAESGIYTTADLQRLARCGARAVLVGESLMRSPDIRSAVRALLGT